MKIIYESLYEYTIYFIVFMYLGFINFARDLNSISMSLGVVLSIILFFVYLIQKDKKAYVSKYVYIFLLSFLIMFIIDLYRLNYFSLSGYSIIDALIHDRFYIFFILFFPINEVLNDNKRRKRFLNNIYYMGILILIFRFLVWYLYNKLNLNLAPGYFEVMGYTWARNGFTRLSGTFLDNYVWVVTLFKLFTDKHKIINIITLLFTFSYADIVYDSRSQQIAFLLSLVLFILIMSEKTYQKILDVMGAIIILPILQRKGLFNQFFDTFNISNSDYGSSTQIRMNTINIYQSLWLEKNIWLGYGISNDGNYFSTADKLMINQSDLGILSILFQLGIIGFIIMISPLLMGIYVGLKKGKNLQNKFLFLFSITTLMTSIMSQNMYDPFRSLIVPFLLAFISYVRSTNLKGFSDDN